MLVAVTACGGEEPAGPEAGGGLTGDWRSVSVEQRTPPSAPLVAAARVNLLVLSSGRVIASARCNTVSGRLQVEGGRFVLGEPTTTAMKCPDRVRHNEDLWLAGFLTSRPTIANKADRVQLSTDATSIELAPRAVVAPDQPLEGTRWRLTKVTSGWVPSASPSPSAGPAAPLAVTELRFVDGVVRGTSGCARFTGPARVDAGTVNVGALIVDRSDCGAGARTDVESLRAVLSGAVSARIVENSLLLIHPSRRGLTLESASPAPTEPSN